ncbi:hypothetical protein B0O80DRAFT_65805 [Mortierella sp. GBAus27b]|nr:hypothetical protein BGX31_004945 [Mortierella sp. GBA43]KAI8353919.1 hypothetical protein B0O80DRAFT_65805 [Mortierella sp. GBAus27b]
MDDDQPRPDQPEAVDQEQQQQEQDEEVFLYDGPIDPETEKAIQDLNDIGTKAFALQDYELAVEKFGLASEMLGQVYGETNPKCADTLFMYGRALLEHAIKQSSVLGGATAKGSGEEEAASAAEGGSSSAAASSAAGPNNRRFVFEGDEEDDEEEGEGGGGGGEEGEGAGEGGNAGEEEEQDDFAVAWDVLDLARVLYHRQGTEEALLKLGDVHIALGDVSLESENFDQAATDFREAIKIKEARLDSDDRQLAEAHYKLALALEYSPTESENAPDHIHQAIKVLKARIEKLNSILSLGKGKGKATDMNESETKMSKELIELHELIGEMDQKVQDLIANQAKKALEAQAQLEMFSEMFNPKSTAAVNDISSLIKPKATRPTTETASSSSGAAPAPAAENTTTATATEAAPSETDADGPGSKRKAEGEVDEDQQDKKVKV